MTGPGDPVTGLLQPVLADDAHRLMERWSAAHLDQPDGIHAMRVAARRLRSLLATARPFLDRDVVEPLRDELGWLADVLGVARDAEVQLVRVDDAVDALVTERTEVDWDPDHVRPALLAPLQQRHGRAVIAVRSALEGTRYTALVRGLDELVVGPPWSDKATKRIKGPYGRRVKRHLRRLEERMEATTEAHLDSDERAAAFHHARKAVKRARYAVEPLQPVHGRRATKLVKRLKHLQASLGELQDTVITREYLHHLVNANPHELDATVGLVAGAIIEREAVHGTEAEQSAMAAWRRVTAAKPLR